MRLEKYLVLNRYFLNLFGFNDSNELRERLKDTEAGYDSTGRSFFSDALIVLRPEWEESLIRYDDAIREYSERLRQNRKQPYFALKYFQYLAVLFTEIFLDRYYSERQKFLSELNGFLKRFNEENEIEIAPFTEEDLKKIAFWMATGSGKTLVMHINYWQILKYSKKDWDNIILITPNEGLSLQHYKELKTSGVPCRMYDGNIDSLKTRDGEVLVIDIYKLTEGKKGKGVSVDISYFDGKNLVFIDEGHKGQRTEEQKWKNLREKIGKNGFIFEYSATFGQIIGERSDLLEEYAKAIIFDYSYKYFYTDGYGKDFYVYNIKESTYTKTQRNLLLTGGLLSFYEQMSIFEKYKEEVREYNIEKPLWVFVGSKVTGEGINSDVVNVINFLSDVIRDEKYLEDNIKKILRRESGLVDSEGNDIFKGKFESIKDFDPDFIKEDIYQEIFSGKGRLELYEIKNAEGEIGLKISTGEKYFGVINVGDVRALRNLILNSEIEVKEDHFSQSLFSDIKDGNSSVNILIGSKKFIEGWDSWRVSNMGLINMGKGEGPQIIQLFGRGVRVKGKNYSLKREENPEYPLKILQTLFIFGLNADYINAFLTTIEREDVDYKEITIPIRFNRTHEWEGKIYTIKTRDDFDFLQHPVKLGIDEDILRNVKVNLIPKVTIAQGLKVGSANALFNEPIVIRDEYFDLIDWGSVYLDIMNYKIAKEMYNLIIDRETIKQIVKSRKYKILLSESSGISIENNNGKPVLRIISFEGIRRFHEIILMVISEYILKFYGKEEKRKTMNYLEVKPLTISEYPSMYPEGEEVILKIPRELAKEIKEVVEELEKYEPDIIPDSWQRWDSFIIHLDKHLYTPLIIWNKNREEIKSMPVKLNEGETSFVKDFKNFLHSNNTVLDGVEVFLLRNLSRKGIGFFLNSGFYPDFIMWIKKENRQHIIFIDPKGIRNLGNFNDDKIQLCTSYIKEIQKRVNAELKIKGDTTDLQLDSFILSVSLYNDIKKTFGEGGYSIEDFERHHVLFQEEADYLKKIFEKTGVIENR